MFNTKTSLPAVIVTLFAVSVQSFASDQKLTAQENETRDLSYFLNRMKTVSHFPELEKSHTALSSTWNRSGANGDDVDFKNLQGDRNILLDVKGPGCVHRMFVGWLDKDINRTKIRVYLDNAASPVIDVEMGNFFDYKNGIFPYPLVFHKTYPGMFFPIPFEKNCRIELVNPDHKWSNFWQIAYTVYPEGTPVKSLEFPLTDIEQKMLSSVTKSWLHSEAKPPVLEPSWDVDEKFSVSGGQEKEIEINHGGTITNFRVSAEPASQKMLLGTRLKIYWDGSESPSVDVPLGYFFGNADSGHIIEYNSMLMGVAKEHAYSLFPMPFRKKAVIKIENRTDSPLEHFHCQLDIESNTEVPANHGYFHATWKEVEYENADLSKFAKFGPMNQPAHEALEISGIGKYVGLLLHVDWDHHDWWGEGDWLIWTDEQDWPPSYHGTGSEEYFNSGWGRFDRKAISGFIDTHPGNINLYTFHLNDHFQFQDNIKIVEEIMAWTFPKCRVIWGSTAFWYAKTPTDAQSRQDVIYPRVSKAKNADVSNDGSADSDTSQKKSLSGDDWTIVSFEPGEGVKAKAFESGYSIAKAVPAVVPGDVHWDLERAGKISDIYYGMNSRKAWWVATKEWWYRKKFDLNKEWRGKTVRLHFDAVDYKADIWLNGNHLGQHEGSFTPFEFEITDDLVFDRGNVLTVQIHAAPKDVTDTIEKDVWEWTVMGAMRPAYPYWKSMTSSGWDWGCDIISMGIWQDVSLIASEDVYLSNLTVLPEVPAPYDKATLNIKMNVDAKKAKKVKLEYKVKCLTVDHKPLIVQEQFVSTPGKAEITSQIELKNPHLWWPNGYGEQHLYELTTTALDSETGDSLSQVSTTFGVRDLKMLANPHSADNVEYMHHRPSGIFKYPDPKPELKYLMQINGRKIMGMGSNWIPCDMLFGRPGGEFHEHLVRLAAQANFNLFRIWGGGLIDKQVFFDLCDQYGIMVYAEFPNGGPHLPETDEGLAITASETRQILPLLMNHPSVVRYSGGNEWYTNAENSRQMAQLRQICNEVDPTRPFHDPDPETIAQRHAPHWYHVAPHHEDNCYKLYNTGYPLSGGPNDPLEWTEYGAGGMSSIETLKRIMPQENLWPINPRDPYWIWHKAFEAYLGENWLAPSEYEYLFGKPVDLETALKCSQFAQAEGLRYANQTHRRHLWHRSAFASWTYNEPWPNAAHGCIVEHFGKTKMAYYYFRQSCAQVDISAVYDSLVCTPQKPLQADLWVSNLLEKSLKDHTIRWRIYSTSGQLLDSSDQRVDVSSSSSTKVAEIKWAPKPEMAGDVALLNLELLSPAKKVVAQNLYTYGIQQIKGTALPSKVKQINKTEPPLKPLLHAPKTKLSVNRTDWRKLETGGISCSVEVANISDKPALFVKVSADTSQELRVYYQDNYFFIPPTQKRRIEVVITSRKGHPIDRNLEVQAQAWNSL